MDYAQMKPAEKRVSALLWAHVLHDRYPSPTVPQLYMGFGYCTCTKYGDEGILSELYLDLIRVCTFEEFWTAHAGRQLMGLFETYGLDERCRQLRHLEGYLRCGATYPSVWDLYRFVVTREVEPCASVRDDYGFANCSTLEQRLELKEVYAELFQLADPMRLHRARMLGVLYAFTSHYIDVDPRLGTLMHAPRSSSNR